MLLISQFFKPRTFSHLTPFTNRPKSFQFVFGSSDQSLHHSLYQVNFLSKQALFSHFHNLYPKQKPPKTKKIITMQFQLFLAFLLPLTALAATPSEFEKYRPKKYEEAKNRTAVHNTTMSVLLPFQVSPSFSLFVFPKYHKTLTHSEQSNINLLSSLQQDRNKNRASRFQNKCTSQIVCCHCYQC